MDNKRAFNARSIEGNDEAAVWVLARSLPTGTVTFLFTDIQGSTPLWERQPEKMAEALQIHNAALRQAIEANGGVVYKTVGDAFQAVFDTAPQALAAAIEGQQALQNAPWNELGPLSVRMGLHTGEAQLDPGGDEYAVSHTKNRIGRIHSAAHGGQILLSQESADLVRRNLPAGVTLKDLGEHCLKGMQWLEHLYQACAPGLPQEFPPLATALTCPNNLPLQLTSFIGREKEIAEVVNLLGENRLVTLTGAGGTGKTRLALRVAEALADIFTEGIWFVELAPLTDPKLVVQTVALSLGLREEAGSSFLDGLLYFLKTRQVLLVLDNCEHLIEACARLADNLLHSCPRLKLLASSREALGVAGEIVFHVPSLSMPDPQERIDLARLVDYDAMRLFVVRGKAVLPSFQITPENVQHIVKICERLDGIPLALELAAARLVMLSTEQLAARLDNTFRLLVGGARTAVPRQQTLRATIDWSYRLLSAPEQLLLRRLSVFVGSCSLEGVEAVCAGDGLEESEILDLLTSLVNKSMVITDRVQGVRPRYHLLEMVRQYGREKLFDAGESETLRDHHLDYYISFADRAEPQIHGAGRLEWTGYLKTEHANLREALEWAFKEPCTAPLGLRVATAIADRFWFTLGYHREEERWLKSGLQIAGEKAAPHLQARVYYNLGRVLSFNDFNQSKQVLERCITSCRQIGPAAYRELALALSLSTYMVDSKTAVNRAAEAVQVARSIAPTDGWPLIETLYFQSDILLCYGFDDRAYAAAEECVQVARSGDRWIPGGYWVLGIVQTRKNQLKQARENLEKGLELCLEVDDRVGIWYSLLYLGWHHRRAGQFHQAHVYLHELLKLYDRLRSWIHFYDLPAIAALLVVSQDQATAGQVPAGWLDAVRLFAAFEIWSEVNLNPNLYFDRLDYRNELDRLRQNIDPATFDATWEEGRKLAESLDDAVKYALSLGEKNTFQDHQA